MTGQLEWWPDYGSGPLWEPSGRGGVPVEPSSLNLGSDLADRLARWNAEYAEDKLPTEGGGDGDWIGRGVRLLAKVRHQLAGRFEVSTTEPWWGELPEERTGGQGSCH